MAQLDCLLWGLWVSAGEFRGPMMEFTVWLCTRKENQTCEFVTRRTWY